MQDLIYMLNLKTKYVIIYNFNNLNNYIIKINIKKDFFKNLYFLLYKFLKSLAYLYFRLLTMPLICN